jgi:D-alanyl-D-alanine carboxypeptidase/D-alanyl-D-alanine-endopeptidase (penicillin-binding protein 4)
VRWTSAAAGASVIGASIVTVVLLLVPSDAPLHGLVSSPSSSSAAPTPSASPALSPGVAGPVLPSPSGTSVPTSAGLIAALRVALAQPALKGHTALAVVDVATGHLLVRQGDIAAQPASTLKLLTAAAALSVLGPDARLKTGVVSVPGSDRIVLVGDGDATLASTAAAAAAQGSGAARPASIEALARSTADALKAAGHRTVRLSYDASLFSGSPTATSWPTTYVPTGVVSPVTALSVDGGRTAPGADSRSTDPPAAAAAALAHALGQEGVRVIGTQRPSKAAPGAVPVAAVSSPPLGLLVERMLTESDNDLAEALAHRTAVGARQPGTFAGGAVATIGALKGLGLDVTGLHLVDGSGLSHADRVPPRLLAQVLATAAGSQSSDTVLRPMLSGLPVAGWTGTLADRFTSPATAGAAGVVRAKTGTLGTVSTLAGTAVDADGRVLAFAVLADGLPAGTTLEARAALDEAAAAIAGCGCR